MPDIQYLETAARTGCLICWFGFLFVFLLRRRPARSVQRKQASGINYGLLMQTLGFSIVWFLQRSRTGTFLQPPDYITLVFSLIAVPLTAMSLLLVVSAVRTLGKQWSLEARVVEGHELITTGPYAIVRNPIYTGMFGMLIGTGCAVSHWAGLLIGIAVFFAGTRMRVGREEVLLRETFGADFDEYAGRVPRLLPFSHAVVPAGPGT